MLLNAGNAGWVTACLCDEPILERIVNRISDQVSQRRLYFINKVINYSDAFYNFRAMNPALITGYVLII